MKFKTLTFDHKYFEKLYPKNETIDGDYNSKQHAQYLWALFELMGVHVSRVYDFGFGKGTLLRDVAKKLEATRVGGCDVSQFAYKNLKHKKWANNFDLKAIEIHRLAVPRRPHDLGLCNSVLQYVPDQHLKKTVEVMASSCKYLYLHVPTTEDYRILKRDLDFTDPYAIHRQDKVYRNLLMRYFNFVSWGLLESKKYSSYNKSAFEDSLYRF